MKSRKITKFQAVCIKNIHFPRISFFVKVLQVVDVTDDPESKYFLVRNSQSRGLVWWFSKKKKTLPNEYFYDYFRKI
jgi:hypothetical protein